MTKTSTRTPGAPTDLNLFALTELVIANGGRIAFSNRIAATDRPHIVRCMRAGLIAADGEMLRLTDAGRAIVHNRIRAKVTQFGSPVYRGSAFHERLRVDAAAALDVFEAERDGGS